jgi:hypothetical protein
MLVLFIRVYLTINTKLINQSTRLETDPPVRLKSKSAIAHFTATQDLTGLIQRTTKRDKINKRRITVAFGWDLLGDLKWHSTHVFIDLLHLF